MNASEVNLSPETGETNKVCDTSGQKKCSKCGSEFPCGAAARAATGGADFSCWCEELPGVAPVEGEDCLCPGCLRDAIAKRGEASLD